MALDWDIDEDTCCATDADGNAIIVSKEGDDDAPWLWFVRGEGGACATKEEAMQQAEEYALSEADVAEMEAEIDALEIKIQPIPPDIWKRAFRLDRDGVSQPVRDYDDLTKWVRHNLTNYEQLLKHCGDKRDMSRQNTPYERLRERIDEAVEDALAAAEIYEGDTRLSAEILEEAADDDAS